MSEPLSVIVRLACYMFYFRPTNGPSSWGDGSGLCVELEVWSEETPLTNENRSRCNVPGNCRSGKYVRQAFSTTLSFVNKTVRFNIEGTRESIERLEWTVEEMSFPGEDKKPTMAYLPGATTPLILLLRLRPLYVDHDVLEKATAYNFLGISQSKTYQKYTNE